MDRISARSPYYVVAPIYNGVDIVEVTDATFNIKIWQGDIVTDKPVENTYTINKAQRYSGDTHIFVEISEQIRDYLIQSFPSNDLTGYGSSVVFVEVVVVSEYDGGTIEETNTHISLDAYGSFQDGVNPSFSDLLISNRYISILSEENIRIPVYLGGDEYNFKFYSNASIQDDIDVLPISITDTDNTVFIVDSIDDNTTHVVVSNVTQASDFVIDIESVTECIYSPVKCVFVNKFGVKQDLWFYKVSKENINVTNESYNRSTLETSMDGNTPIVSYNSTKHTNKRYNTNAKKSITLNTGYINEDNNVLIEELLLSEDVWLVINDVIYPVDNATKTTDFLTKRNDQLVKYTMKFDYSYSQIQNIR